MRLRSPEAALQDQVIDLAEQFGWRRAHFRPARLKDGSWRTPVQADGKGFPDLLLIRAGKLLVRELKSEAGIVTHEQQAWLDAFAACGVDVAVWRPSSWDAILRELR